MDKKHKAGFVNIFGPPNAGKSTLLNALLDERITIVSPKVQTTRHRILGILSEPDYQIVFSDTPGIIDPKYKLHTRMMKQVHNAVEDTDVALLMISITDNPEEISSLIKELGIKGFKILLINKVDLIKDKEERESKINTIQNILPADLVFPISAQYKTNLDKILPAIIEKLPENPPFYPEDELSDRPTRFFVSEMIREQVYYLYRDEIPYHTAVVIQSFEEEPKIIKIRADIVVTRETQKFIIIGKGGNGIKQLGINARKNIEDFLGRKIFLQLFVKVRPDWRKKDNFLSEYGY